MLEQIATLIVGLIGGIAVGTQTPIANLMGQRVGSISSSFFIHFSGTILSVLLLIARGGERILDPSRVSWWMLGTGIFGVVLYVSINHTIPRLGVTAATSLIIVGQLLAGMMIDHFGWFEVAQRSVDGTRILAAALLLAGAYLMSK